MVHKIKLNKRDLAYIRRLPDKGLREMGRSRDEFGKVARIELKTRGKSFKVEPKQSSDIFGFSEKSAKRMNKAMIDIFTK